MHCKTTPVSTVGAKLEWKNAQKTARKNIINKVRRIASIVYHPELTADL
jgi:hypothetical protein